MLTFIVEFAIRRRYFVLTLAGLLVVVGTLAFLRLPFDAFPDTTPVMVQVNAEAVGWAPEEIERQITYPIERELSGLTGLQEVRSISKFGLSNVTLIFDDKIDVYQARQQVTERLVSVQLPDGLPRPELGPVSTGLGEIFHYLVIARSADPTEARTVQEWIIKPQLQAVAGVAEINTWGGFEKQFQILVDPNRLVQFNLSLHDVAESLRESLGNVSGGTMVRGGEQTVVQGLGQVTTRDEIEALVIGTRGGLPLQVRDVAEVVVGHEIRRGASTAGGLGEVVLGLGFMITGENSHDVAARLAARLEEVKKSLPENVELRPVYVRTELVDRILHTVRDNLLYGAALVVAILFLFMGNFRAGLIAASSIPLSMLFAFDAMTRVGIVGSLMSLGAIDFGLAVDNAVIQVENSLRHLSHDKSGRNRLEIIRDAILEVRKPTLFGELIIILVYLPILTLEGVEGKMFRPMALTVVFVLIGALILSFTVIPALVATFLKKPSSDREPFLVRLAQRAYRPALHWALRNRAAISIASIVLMLIGAVMFSRIGKEFIPRLNEGTIVINTVRLAGVSLPQSVDYSTRVEQLLLKQFPDEIADIWSRTGTAELSTDPMGIELTDMFITLTPREAWKKARSQDELVAAIDRELVDLPGMNKLYIQPIEMRVNEMIAGIRSDVGIKVFGDDLEMLRVKADEIAQLASQVRGSADVSVEQMTGQPQLRLAVDRVESARFGIPANEVLSYIQALGGTTVGEVFEGQRRFDLVLKLDSAWASSPEDIELIPLRGNDGAIVTLDRIAQPQLTEGYATITREWGKRRAVVQCNVRGRDVGSFVDELRGRIDRDVKFEPGYYVQFGGQFQNMERAQLRLAIVVPLALVLIMGLLYMTYGSLRDALLIFSGVPLAAIGGMAALMARGLPFSISAGVGFITLSGLAVLNGLVLVSQIKRSRSDGRDLDSAISEAAMVRLRPVLMTALVAAIGFCPMAFSGGFGAEVQRPLATVVVGGILTSTALTLIILPVLYSLFGKKSAAEI